MEEPGRIDVGTNHKRGILATLRVLDEDLCHIEAWARGKETHSVLFHEKNCLSPAQCDAMLQEIAALRAVLQKVRTDLDLNSPPADIVRAVISKCLTASDSLVELTGKHLRRYGKPSSELGSYLDTEVAVLLAHIERIADVARAKPVLNESNGHKNLPENMSS